MVFLFFSQGKRSVGRITKGKQRAAYPKLPNCQTAKLPKWIFLSFSEGKESKVVSTPESQIYTKEQRRKVSQRDKYVTLCVALNPGAIVVKGSTAGHFLPTAHIPQIASFALLPFCPYLQNDKMTK